MDFCQYCKVNEANYYLIYEEEKLCADCFGHILIDECLARHEIEKIEGSGRNDYA